MSDLETKAKKIKLLLLDLDGVLTEGLIYYGHEYDIKAFHTQDGFGLRYIQKLGIKVAVISGKKTKAGQLRLDDLKIKHVYLGYEDKLPVYENLKHELNLQDDEIAYIGDDLPDLPILRRVGFAATVPNGMSTLHPYVDYITKREGGKGAVREVCEIIIAAQNYQEQMLKDYLK